MKKDITEREDVVLLVNTFYIKVNSSPILGPIFNDVARIDWDTHLPKMHSFWSSLLLGEQSFSGNPMKKHIHLSTRTTMSETEFSEWLRLFYETVDDLFEGNIATEAKIRASNIAQLMLQKIQAHNHI